MELSPVLDCRCYLHLNSEPTIGDNLTIHWFLWSYRRYIVTDVSSIFEFTLAPPWFRLSSELLLFFKKLSMTVVTYNLLWNYRRDLSTGDTSI